MSMPVRVSVTSPPRESSRSASPHSRSVGAPTSDRASREHGRNTARTSTYRLLDVSEAPLSERPWQLAESLRAAPTVDLRDRDADVSSHLADDLLADSPAWEWCVGYARRLVELSFPSSRDVSGDTIKGF